MGVSHYTPHPELWEYKQDECVWVHKPSGTQVTDMRQMIEVENSMAPKFTKRHYDELAIVLRNSFASLEGNDERMFGATVVVSGLLNALQKDNPRFKKDAFIKALRGEQE
jgi:hypothetical protein